MQQRCKCVLCSFTLKTQDDEIVNFVLFHPFEVERDKMGFQRNITTKTTVKLVGKCCKLSPSVDSVDALCTVELVNNSREIRLETLGHLWPSSYWLAPWIFVPHCLGLRHSPSNTFCQTRHFLNEEECMFFQFPSKQVACTHKGARLTDQSLLQAARMRRGSTEFSSSRFAASDEIKS